MKSKIKLTAQVSPEIYIKIKGTSDNVYTYSLNHFGRPLCMRHQELQKQSLSCQNCKQPIDSTVFYYSIGRFGKPLCMHCQKVLDRMPQKGENTFDGKGVYCNRCKKTISFPQYKISKKYRNIPLAKTVKELIRNSFRKFKGLEKS
jgi:hypothetical protein